jgi:VIT1/CCC1 family predicted Fe2+/Mn2+ transporter
MKDDVEDRKRRYREHWGDEIDGAAMYRSLAERSEGEQRDIFSELAAAEERHASHWARMLVELGEPEPRPEDHRLGRKARFVRRMARWFGPKAVLPMIERAEVADAGHYDDVPEATTQMSMDERIHARVVSNLTPSNARAGIVQGERWHRGDASGALRAAIFGVSDGLVSNLSLVMGVAGGTGDATFIMLAGVAGLLAGAFSMGAGEFVSVSSQVELFQREIALEREEIAAMPDEEAQELALIYRAKGIPRQEAEALAHGIMADPEHALDTMAREELGLNPEELGSPWRVAFSSFLAFAAGAIVPVLPFLFGQGTAAFVTSLAISAVALFAVGAAISVLTGRPLVRSGLRQLLVGGLAAGVTFCIGRLIGVAVG